jgi:hypothetical protein
MRDDLYDILDDICRGSLSGKRVYKSAIFEHLITAGLKTAKFPDLGGKRAHAASNGESWHVRRYTLSPAVIDQTDKIQDMGYSANVVFNTLFEEGLKNVPNPLRDAGLAPTEVPPPPVTRQGEPVRKEPS